MTIKTQLTKFCGLQQKQYLKENALNVGKKECVPSVPTLRSWLKNK